MTKSSSAAGRTSWWADWLIALPVVVGVPVLSPATEAAESGARSVLVLQDRAAAATAAAEFEPALIGHRGAAPAPPGYDPDAQAADDEGERAARTIAFNTQAVPGTVATPHEQSDGSAQTGKP